MNIIALVCLVQKDWHAITVCGIEDTLGDHHNLLGGGGGGGGGCYQAGHCSYTYLTAPTLRMYI